MKKTFIAIIAVFALASQAANAASDATQAYLDGARSLASQGRATYVQGFFTGVTLARAYDLPGTCINAGSNHAVLAMVADAVNKGIGYENLGDASSVADLAIRAAFPCDKE